MVSRILFLIFISVFLVAGCKKNEIHQKKIFTLLSSDETSINFENTVKNTPDFNIFSYRNFYNGGGVALGDINNDGLQDVFLTSNMGENKLYLNEGNLKFRDITSIAGIGDKNKWSTGVSMVDINNDGFLDIYVCNAGFQEDNNAKNTLYINNGDLTFTESASTYGLDDEGYTTHAAFFDYDMDGDLDVYILNNSFIPVNTLNYTNARELRAKDWPVKDFLKGGGDKLMRNDGGKFTDVSESAGIYGSLIGFGLGVTVGDVNGDFLPDIYVSNDFFERDYLYINRGDGTFSEELEQRMGHISTSSMGADMADLNNDGCPEIFVTDMLPHDETRLKTTTTFDNINIHNLKVKNGFYHQFLQNSLQMNDPSGHFRETAFYSGVAASDWSWGALMFDADQDMQTDIFVCNGIYHDVIDQDFIDFFANEVIQEMVMNGKKEQLDSVINRMPSMPLANMMFRNKGNMKFESVAETWGLHHKTFSNGAAYGDLDNDGDLDLIINNVNQQVSVYRNDANEINKSNFIGFQLKSPKPNIDAIGSTVKVYCNGVSMMRQHIPNRGFQSSVDMRLNFGLGQNSKVDSVVIYWPDRTYSTIYNPEINKYLLVNKSEVGSLPFKKQEPKEVVFEQISHNLESHLENLDFIDFYYERNIPKLLSREGPKIAVADINNDGYDDLYICGALGQSGQLYFGGTEGYKKTVQPIFESFKVWEDTEAVFFDADGDGDLDLFVGSGGNNGPPLSREFLDRLYFNDGNGRFEIDTKAFPSNGFNTSKAIPMDFDGDGDMDLFVASRSFPGEYGMNPPHFLYENNGNGRFREVLINSGSELSEAGMITDAYYGKFFSEGPSVLIVVGEWATPQLYKYNGKKFERIKSNLDEYSGFWQSVHVVDVDKDGDLDLILGNEGSNGYLHIDQALPLKLFINDFDQNGMPEKLLTRTIENRDIPIMMKRDMVDQLNFLKKQNLKHKDYSQRSLQDLLGKRLDNALVKTVTHTKSYIAYNEGNGQFRVEELPIDAQLSSVNDIIDTDINQDGFPDLILVGNTDGFLPQFGRLDCNFGIVLLNDKQGGFSVMKKEQSGIFIKGFSKQIKLLNQKGKDVFIVARNNDTPYIFTKK